MRPHGTKKPLFRGRSVLSCSSKVERGLSEFVCPFLPSVALSIYLALNNEMPPQSALKWNIRDVNDRSVIDGRRGLRRTDERTDADAVRGAAGIATSRAFARCAAVQLGLVGRPMADRFEREGISGENWDTALTAAFPFCASFFLCWLGWMEKVGWSVNCHRRTLM